MANVTMTNILTAGIPNRRTIEYYVGCLLGGAVGDALGAPIEHGWSLARIRAIYGAALRDFVDGPGTKAGAISDDTQLTMFTAEGLIRADMRLIHHGSCHPPAVIHRAYLRWLATQIGRERIADPALLDGWLIRLPTLHQRRHPSATVTAALYSRSEPGQPASNNSKGSSAVMSAAPIGLVGLDGPDPFQLARDCARLTHGHPSGYLPAAFLAATIAAIVNGVGLRDAIHAATLRLRFEPGHQETLEAVQRAVRFAHELPPTAETAELLGSGRSGEEAIAIAVFCALVAEDFEHGVILATNHGGASSTTGGITGCILGALYGKSAIPARWRTRVELRDEITTLAIDLYRHFATDERFKDDPIEWDRYPGW